VTDSGLRGRGGAGFPTGIKWKTVADTKAAQKYIVCNADEGDSGTFADRMIMEGDPFCLIEGMSIAGVATGATKGTIYIRSEYPHAIATMNATIAAARHGGMLGARIAGSDFAFDIEVRVGAGAMRVPRHVHGGVNSGPMTSCMRSPRSDRRKHSIVKPARFMPPHSGHAGAV
jgi:formate dehydrogenase iron-sulfur subunit